MTAVDHRSPSSVAVRAVCWWTIALEGFDIVVLGVVLPVLLRDPALALTPAGASSITLAGLVGTALGAFAAAPLADRAGRRRALLTTVVVFSAATVACATAPDATALGAWRFVAGVGIGGAFAICLLLVGEHAPTSRQSSATTTAAAAFNVGAVLAALAGILLIDTVGWRGLLLLGGAPAVVLVPLLSRLLPRQAPPASTTAPARGPVAELFGRSVVRSTAALGVASFMGFLLVSGLNSWLPVFMRSAGYDLTTALALLVALNTGGFLGLLVAGRVANRIGASRAGAVSFALSAVALVLLALRPPQGVALAGMLLAGPFVFSAPPLVYARVFRLYPPHARATALSAGTGAGRIGTLSGPFLGGSLLGAGVAYPWGIYAFAGVAATGGLAALGAEASRAARVDRIPPSATAQEQE